MRQLVGALVFFTKAVTSHRTPRSRLIQTGVIFLSRSVESCEHVLDVFRALDRDIDGDRRIPNHARNSHRPPKPVIRHYAVLPSTWLCGLSSEPITIAAPDNKYVAIPE